MLRASQLSSGSEYITSTSKVVAVWLLTKTYNLRRLLHQYAAVVCISICTALSGAAVVVVVVELSGQ